MLPERTSSLRASHSGSFGNGRPPRIVYRWTKDTRCWGCCRDFGRTPKATPLPSCLPSLSRHLAPRNSAPGPQGPSCCSQRRCWKRTLREWMLSSVSLGQNGLVSHQGQCVLRPWPHWTRGRPGEVGAQGLLCAGCGEIPDLGALPSLWVPYAPSRMGSPGCHTVSHRTRVLQRGLASCTQFLVVLVGKLSPEQHGGLDGQL